MKKIATLILCCFIVSNSIAGQKQHSTPSSSISQHSCLQRAILAEARGTDKATMQAVADVVVNRAKQQKKSVCNVLKQKNQFAKLYPIKTTNSKNQSSQTTKDLELSSTIAASALANGSKNKQIMFFHTSKKKYAWTKKLRLVKQDKWHRYYAEAD